MIEKTFIDLFIRREFVFAASEF